MRFISQRPAAFAVIRGDKDNRLVRGMVRFYQRPNGVLVEAEISGLPAGSSVFHGFHIHTGNSCEGDGFPVTGGHYALADTAHPRHAGDLPPLLSNNGCAYMAVITDRVSIPELINRTVVIHADPDDFHSQPSGNAGIKIACGVIQRNGNMRKM